jgi:hypothetical protein
VKAAGVCARAVVASEVASPAQRMGNARFIPRYRRGLLVSLVGLAGGDGFA